MQYARRRRDQICHAHERHGRSRIPMRDAVEFRQIPVNKVDALAARADGFWNSQIAAYRDAPGRIDHLRGAAEEIASRNRSCRERSFKRVGLKRRHRHALSVDRIETANRVAEDQKTFRETAELLIPPAEARGKTRGIGPRRSVRLYGPHRKCQSRAMFARTR